jgi:aminoglycoside phosphotransferase (APT) family kinase protein
MTAAPLMPPDRDAILAASGLDPGDVVAWTPVDGATFNTVHRIRLRDGKGLIVKLAPAPAAPAMSYERDLLRTEALFYRAAEAVAPVPRVAHTDFTRQAAGGDVLVMTELPGAPWPGRLPGPERAELRAGLGRIVAAVHRITGPAFGYPQGKLQASWPAAFTAMLDAVLADAERFAAVLPCPPGRIRSALAAGLPALDDVRRPALVHFDLWPGNVLIGGRRVTGLVDAERAFWGDPLADLVSLALFGDIERDQDFLRGYREAGGTVAFDEPTRRRLALYRCYLYLIMLVETVPRGGGRPATAKLAAAHLDRALSALETRRVP